MRIQLRNLFIVANADAVSLAEGSIRITVRRGGQGSPESLARGMLSKGFPVNPGDLATSREDGRGAAQNQRHRVPWSTRGPLHGKRTTLTAEKPVVKGDRRRQLRVDEKSYDPIVPTKVGNRRAPARGGHDIHRREGANRQT